MKPIVHVLGSLSKGGIAQHVATLTNGLANYDKYTIYIVTLKNAENDYKLDNRINHVFIDIRKIFGLYKLINFIRKNNIKIVHTHSIWGDIVGIPLAKFFTTAIVISTKHNAVDLSFTTGRAQCLAYKKLDAAIAISKYIEIDLKAKCIKNKTKHVVIYHGINKVVNNYSSKNIRRELGIPIDAVCIGVVARLIKLKNIDLIISSFQRQFLDRKDVYLIIVGEGKERANLEDQVFDQCKDRVIFVGFQSKVESYMISMDIFILLSSEAFGLVYLEAMRDSKPVICSKFGGACEIVVSEKNGYCVDTGSLNDIDFAVRRLVDSQELRIKFGNASKAIFEKNFQSTTMCKQVDSLYGDYSWSYFC
jgi:glycosyltransferase involved in cell wall biosynthesis